MGKVLRGFGSGTVFFMILMFQLATGIATVIIVGVVDSVMINELGVPATLVGIMLGVQFLGDLLRTWVGSISDRYSFFKLHRTPLVLVGGFITAISYPIIVLVIQNLRNPNFVKTVEDVGTTSGYQFNLFWFLMSVLAFFINSVGLSILGTVALALIVDVTSEKVRGVIAAFSWTVMIAGFVVGSIISLVLLPNTEGYTFVYNSLYPFFFFVIPAIIMVLTIISAIGCYLKEPRVEGVLVKGRTHVSTRQAIGVMRRNPVALWFFAFIATMMAFMFMRDLLIPAYGGNVFKMTVKERSGLQGLVNGPILVAMISTGIISLWIAKKTLAYIGLAVTVVGIAIQSLSAFLFKADQTAIIAYQTASKNLADKVITQAEFNTALQTWNSVIGGSKGMFTVGIVIMGIGLGICVPGLIGLMMDITDKANAAFYIGVWGIASGVGQGLSNLMAGGMRDVAVNVFADNISTGYGFVFAIQATGMFIALLILNQVNVKKFKYYLEKSYDESLAYSKSAVPAFATAAEVPGASVVWYDTDNGMRDGQRAPAINRDGKETEIS